MNVYQRESNNYIDYNSINEDTQIELISDEDYIQSVCESYDMNGMTAQEIKKLADKEKAPASKVKTILTIILIIILAVPIIVLTPIILLVMAIIDSCKDKMSARELEKTIKKLEKVLAKLEKKLEKAKTEEEKKEIQKQIDEVKKQIESLKKEKEKAEKEKRLGYEMDLIEQALKDEKDKWCEFGDGYGEEYFTFDIAYNKWNDAFINKMYGGNTKEDYYDIKYQLEHCGIYPDDDEDDKYFYDFILKNLGDKIRVVFAIDDTATIYGIKTKKIYHGDWDSDPVFIHSIDYYRKKGEEMCKQESFIEADAELGIYRLSKKPKE